MLPSYPALSINKINGNDFLYSHVTDTMLKESGPWLEINLSSLHCSIPCTKDLLYFIPQRTFRIHLGFYLERPFGVLRVIFNHRYSLSCVLMIYFRLKYRAYVSLCDHNMHVILISCINWSLISKWYSLCYNN